MISIPAIRVSALFGALVFGFLPFYPSSSSASSVLIDESSHEMDTTSRLHRLDLMITLDDQGDDVSANGRLNHMGDAWHDATLLSSRTFLLDADHLGISPVVGGASIINASIVSEDGHGVAIDARADLPSNDIDASHQSLFSRMVSAVTSAAASIPLSLPLFGLALICLSLIARRGKKQAADLT